MVLLLRVRSAHQRLEPVWRVQWSTTSWPQFQGSDKYFRSHKNKHSFAAMGLSCVNSSVLLKVQHSMGSECCRELHKRAVCSSIISMPLTEEAAVFYTKHLLHQLSFYYTRNLLNQKPLTPNTRYSKLLFTPETCMPKRLLPTKPLTPKSLSHKKTLARKAFHTKKPMYEQALATKAVYTQNTFTPKTFKAGTFPLS